MATEYRGSRWRCLAMWRALLVVVVACSPTRTPAPIEQPAESTRAHAPIEQAAESNASTPPRAPPRTGIAADGAKAKPAPIPVEPVPFGPDPVDDGTTRGAVADPSLYVVDDEAGINFFDTTVTLDELPTITAKWQKRERVRYKGRVPIAIHNAQNATLALSFVAPVDITVSDYPGTLKTIELLDSETSPINDNAFRPLRWEAYGKDRGGSVGPIHAAIRVLPTRTSPESERRQVVVYTPPRSKVVLVATKLVGESTWTPLLRIDTPNATRIDLINPGWH